MALKYEVKKWLKGVAFWTTKGGVKSSEETVVASESESTFRKKEKRKNLPEPKLREPSRNAGRPAALDQEKLELILRAYYSHPYSFRELADMFGVSRMTVWRAVQDTAPEFARAIG